MDPLSYHQKYHGKISVTSKVSVKTQKDLSLAYSPGVAEPCKAIYEDGEKVYDYTSKGNLVAVVSDGSAVLGLGNIGPEASLPVMEGKAILFKEFAGVDAFPICLATQDTETIIQTVKNIAPSFGGINLEDISAPRCFEIEERLKKELSIPVFHDDQHGTAIVTLAGLLNAAKVVDKKILDLRIVINGSGAAGIAIAKLLFAYGIKDITMCDSHGALYEGRDFLNSAKKEMMEKLNISCKGCGLSQALKGKDVFIGVSKGNIVTPEMVRSMAPRSILFTMANPIPEIFPQEALDAGAMVVGTGRSDFPNQINNVLVFPGLFRGVLDARITQITQELKLFVAETLASLVENPISERVVPEVLDKTVAPQIAQAILTYSKEK